MKKLRKDNPTHRASPRAKGPAIKGKWPPNGARAGQGPGYY